jgi:hypothetical protein
LKTSVSSDAKTPIAREEKGILAQHRGHNDLYA